MAGESGKQPGVPGASGAPLQREADDRVPEAWLVEAGHEDLADSVDRLAGDLELVNDLALRSYTGPLWDYFSNELAKYGYVVIRSWLRRNIMFERCRSKGLGGLPELAREFSDDEIEGFANETVGKALFHFRQDVLMKRTWDYRKGATLRTFFIGQCLIRFPNIYRSWLRQENRNRYDTTEDDEFLDYNIGRIDGPESNVVACISVDEALRKVKNPRVRTAIHMRVDGWSQGEIAQVLGVTEKAVERMLANERDRWTRRGVA